MLSSLTSLLLDSSSPLNVHLIGVAGSGMSGIASLLLSIGHKVSGSDRVTSGEVQRLQKRGLLFQSPHTPQEVEGKDIVCYSSAIKEDNPALAMARSLGIPCVRRAECLAAILNRRKGVVIAGTHGKTTTSALSTHLLRRSTKTPSHYIGAEIPLLGSNAHWEEDEELFVIEGDESDGTLALYTPYHSVILNIEADHLDYYNNLEEIEGVFSQLIEQTQGKVIYCKECPIASRLCSSLDKGIAYGWENADYTATITGEHAGGTTFDFAIHGEKIASMTLGVPGKHNVLNALAALALCHLEGGSLERAGSALSTFVGAKRRFEKKYHSPSLQIIDDYAHHPTEIAATLLTASKLQAQRIVVAFQPHRYSRTKEMAEEFGKVLQHADVVFITDIYPASEKPIKNVDAHLLIQSMKKYGDTPAYAAGSIPTAHQAIGSFLKDGDLLLTMGAGNVHEIGTRIAKDHNTLLKILSVAPQGHALGKLYEPMRRHTTMLCGGVAQFWIEPQTFESLAAISQYCRQTPIAQRIIGRGSNLLIRDGGLRGVVLHPKLGCFGELSIEGNTVHAGAGVRLKKLAHATAKAGLTGLEWMEGIPGNLGGALRMNAGAMHNETFDTLQSLTVLTPSGEITTLQRDAIEVFYRNVPLLREHFALKASFLLQPSSADKINKKLEDSREKRRTSQPPIASAGCIFKNPESIPAGQLIEELGLKGLSIGKAQVSTIHGNFIINTGGATSSDILHLIAHIQKTAMQQRGITLHTEVQILGEETDDFLF